MIYRFTHDMYYANPETLSDEVLDLVATANPPLEWFCIDMAAVSDVDYTSAVTLTRLHGQLSDREIAMVSTYVSERVHRALRRAAPV